jgi:16S rRNA (guanine966-N2)-methyltransferase
MLGKKTQNQLRIIGGKWRSRKLSFPDIKGLRPTPDRIRETLFNWLAPIIRDSSCLDLFAGSGVLGFEALSRGAKEVIFVDESRRVIEQISANQQLLNCQAKTYCLKAKDYLHQTTQSFDTIFLDPPFQQNLLEPICQLIHEKQLIKTNGHIYIEHKAKLKQLNLPANWQITKQKQAGNVTYLLILITDGF